MCKYYEATANCGHHDVDVYETCEDAVQSGEHCRDARFRGHDEYLDYLYDCPYGDPQRYVPPKAPTPPPAVQHGQHAFEPSGHEGFTYVREERDEQAGGPGPRTYAHRQHDKSREDDIRRPSEPDPSKETRRRATREPNRSRLNETRYCSRHSTEPGSKHVTPEHDKSHSNDRRSCREESDSPIRTSEQPRTSRYDREPDVHEPIDREPIHREPVHKEPTRQMDSDEPHKRRQNHAVERDANRHRRSAPDEHHRNRQQSRHDPIYEEKQDDDIRQTTSRPKQTNGDRPKKKGSEKRAKSTRYKIIRRISRFIS